MSCFPCDRRYDNVSFTFGRTLSPVHITPAKKLAAFGPEREARTVTINKECVEFGDKGGVVGGRGQPGHLLFLCHGAEGVVLASKSVTKTVGDGNQSMEPEHRHSLGGVIPC